MPIEVTVKLNVHGRQHEATKKTLARVLIENDGQGTHELGDYKWSIRYDDGDIWRGTVHNWLRENGAVALLSEVLDDAFGK